jgi:2-polyprenyl-3-methyl-5-hydroxy-6-metoxy-1,4-benzoquinol methylase
LQSNERGAAVLLDDFPYVGSVSSTLGDEAPYLQGIIVKQHALFGDQWLRAFEDDLAICFAQNLEALRKAARGYIKFALEGMLLQKRFDKSRRYETKNFEQATAEVYSNEEYMHTLYLPGIYLSHFLWRHHYLQYKRFQESFLPLILKHGGGHFYDVGVGTGFYSREMLRNVPNLTGTGFDLSQHSLKYTENMISAFGLGSRYSCHLRNILVEPIPRAVPFIVNVEVLEHLEDPVAFLTGLGQILEPGGFGMITAAVTAPNADHIYLYNSVNDVVAHIEAAGFRVIDACEDAAYQPLKPHESVPRNASVIVTR